MNRIHSNSDSAAGVTALTHHHLSTMSVAFPRVRWESASIV